jgi:hypothetical protein
MRAEGQDTGHFQFMSIRKKKSIIWEVVSKQEANEFSNYCKSAPSDVDPNFFFHLIDTGNGMRLLRTPKVSLDFQLT